MAAPAESAASANAAGAPHFGDGAALPLPAAQSAYPPPAGEAPAATSESGFSSGPMPAAAHEARAVRPTRPPREILLSFEDDEPKVAIFEDGVLVEVDFDRPAGRRIVGNIYKGRVQNVLPGMQAAFVDVGLERNAFLFVDDAQPASACDAGEDQPEDAPVRSGASITCPSPAAIWC
jgi:hypothetical protein